MRQDETVPSDIHYCKYCLTIKIWKYLLDTNGGMSWFSFCDNPECKYGPKIIRDLKE